MIYKLHDIIPQNINLSDGDLILHQISLDDIFLIWKFQGKNNFINESCRPVSNRNNKIYAQTGEFNKSSINLLKQLHFHCDGHLREHHELDGILYEDYLFSLTRNDWLKYTE